MLKEITYNLNRKDLLSRRYGVIMMFTGLKQVVWFEWRTYDIILVQGMADRITEKVTGW